MSIPSFGVGTFRLTGQAAKDTVRNALELGYRAVDTAHMLTKQAIDVVGKGRLATNQIELSPYLQNRKVVAFLQEQGIAVTSYMTLAYGKVLRDRTIGEIARKHHATPAQVALAWALQLGYAVIPSSTKRENLASNLLAQQLRLDDEDMARIATLERNGREVNPSGFAPIWD